ncbi:uncharacterized protein LOC123523335 [Mercenaria mercenaria]|uniref:uncharacterized protein LOC123523335 n=1 Tax=Mercenaria mercenaria TaxID=6596 RepID=UPI00234F346B|nr:uncharacterized protein LOC123523335 [Mercenaria mercenaria]
MDSRSLFIQENLNGYNLPPDSLSDIRGVLMKRFEVKFSEGLSPEGRLAMEQAARKEAESAKSLNRMKQSPESPKRDKNKIKDRSEKKAKNINFTETYAKTSTGRLDGDITDEGINETEFTGLDIGGKSNNEATGNRAQGEEKTNTTLTDNTKLQSVEKCLVWMEVNTETPVVNVNDSAETKNSLVLENDTEQL